MSIEGSGAFKAFYSDLLLKDPEKIKEEQSSIYENVKNTFKALTTYGTDNPAELKINNKSIAIKDLNASDIKVFAKFAKIFFDEVPLSEKQALEISENIDSVKKKFSQKWSDRSAFEDFRMAKTNVFLHERVEPAGETEAEMQLVEIIKANQIKAHDEKKEIEKNKLKAKISNAVAVGAVVVGFGFLAGFTTSIALNASLAIVLGLMAGYFLTLLPGAEALIFNPFRSREEDHQASLDALVKEMEKHESYKKLMSEPKFREEITNYKKLDNKDFLLWLESLITLKKLGQKEEV